MQHTETTYAAKDGLQLYSQHWLPQGAPKAIVCLVHGIGEHSGRYGHVAAALCQAGYGLYTYDLRGHGRSGGPRGHAPNLESMLGDIDRLLAEASRDHPGCPQFLYGHSLGGILVLRYTLDRRQTIQGVVASAPPLRLATPAPALKLWLGQIAYQLAPGLTMSTGLRLEGLSRDQRVIETYRTDPLVHGLVSARFALDFMTSGEWALARAADFHLPLLLMHGTADRITSPQASQEFAARVGSRCTLKLWEGLFHEIHNEPEQVAVLATMIAWLDQQLAGPSLN